MRIEPTVPYTNKSSPGLTDEQKQRQKEALTSVSDHIRYLNREIQNLPPAVGRVVELVCLALGNLIEAERLTLRPPNLQTNLNANGSLSASLKEQAEHQLEAALRELGLRPYEDHKR